MKQSGFKENFQHFFQNIKEHFNKDDIAVFFKKNWRYFAAVALFAVLVVIMVRFSSSADKDSEDGMDTELEGTLPSYEVDAVPKVNEMITRYYTACAAGDIDEVKAVAAPVSDNELSHIVMMSQYAESYQNIVCYTKPGLEEGSYLTLVSVDLKFVNVDTPAPGLEFFYVRTNDNGNFYIDNAYSSYNRMHKELETDEAVNALIREFESQKDVTALQAEVQKRYEEAVAADTSLMNMVTVTLADAYNQWAISVAEAAPQEPGTETQDTEAPSTEEPVTPDTPQEPQQTDNGVTASEPQTLYATDTVNVRQQPNESSEILTKLEVGAGITVNGSTADGWSQVDYNGTTGYVKSEYLAAEAPAVQEPADVSGPAPGSTVQLTNTINIRSSMSETASKVGVAYAGDSVVVEMNYAEGWSKVTWNNKSGYAKTEFIK